MVQADEEGPMSGIVLVKTKLQLSDRVSTAHVDRCRSEDSSAVWGRSSLIAETVTLYIDISVCNVLGFRV